MPPDDRYSPDNRATFKNLHTPGPVRAEELPSVCIRHTRCMNIADRDNLSIHLFTATGTSFCEFIINDCQ